MIYSIEKMQKLIQEKIDEGATYIEFRDTVCGCRNEISSIEFSCLTDSPSKSGQIAVVSMSDLVVDMKKEIAERLDKSIITDIYTQHYIDKRRTENKHLTARTKYKVIKRYNRDLYFLNDAGKEQCLNYETRSSEQQILCITQNGQYL